MEASLRNEYGILYGLDELQAEIVQQKTLETLVGIMSELTGETLYNLFEVLYSSSPETSYDMLEAMCQPSRPSHSELRVLLPFTFLRVIDMLSETDYAQKTLTTLQRNGHNSEMGSKVRMPLIFTTVEFKRYLFGGLLKKDIEQGNLIDLGTSIMATVKSPVRLGKILATTDLKELHLNLNYFSQMYIPFSLVAAVKAVLVSQAKKDVVIQC